MNDRTILSCVKIHDNGDMTSYSKWRKPRFGVTMKLGFEWRRIRARTGLTKEKEGYFLWVTDEHVRFIVHWRGLWR